jgi:uncharacterized protein
MKKTDRFVFDTNVLVSALLIDDSTANNAFRLALDVGSILVSSATLQELNEVLSRDKFDKYLHPYERDKFIEALISEAILIDIPDEIHLCRDPKDDKFLDLAACGNATFIVSGDVHLLELKTFRKTRIVKPAEFISLCQ